MQYGTEKSPLQPIIVRISAASFISDNVGAKNAVKDPILIVPDAHIVSMHDGVFFCPALGEDLGFRQW